MMHVLVTGGAGYIGSHVVRKLLEHGCRLRVVDNLSKGHRRSIPDGLLIEGDLSDPVFLERVFSTHVFDGIIHLAADSLVGESVSDPHKYYRNNIVHGLNLLEAARRHQVRTIVFSSSAAVYGEAETAPITEEHRLAPTNPYGRTKLYFEQMLADYHSAYGLQSVSLRYFNAAGADPAGDIGEDHTPESHLIPLVLKAAQGRLEQVSVFGTDYPTHDGTCVRDYIHVNDLADAHVLALRALSNGLGSRFYNLGNGLGFSVREVIAVAEEVVGKPIPVSFAARRPGDPAVLVASSEKIIRDLGWQPRMDDLRVIIASAWRWHCSHPDGFGD